MKVGDVVGIKNAKVSSFGGKSLNLSNNAQVYIHADHKRIKSLTQWYDDRCDEAGDSDIFQSLISQATPLTETMQRMNVDSEERLSKKEDYAKTCIELVNEIELTVNECQSSGQRIPMFRFSGMLKGVKKDGRFYYEACLNKDCRKKVEQEGEGQYRCMTCSQTFPDFKPQYMFSAAVQDFTGQMYVTFAGEMGDLVLGMSAQEFRKRFEGCEEEKLEEFLDSLPFKPLNLLLRATQDTYNGNNRVRYFAAKALPRNIADETKSLLHRMAIFEDMPAKAEANSGHMNDDDYY